MMTRKLLLTLALLLCATPLWARGKLQGYIEKGGASVTSGGFLSTTKVQQSYPAGTVTAYLAGTLTPATLYSDAAGTAKANPFPADSTGLWFLYAEDGCYDLVFKNGSTVLYTLSDMCIGVWKTGTVTSAATLVLTQSVTLYHVTGTTSITSITAPAGFTGPVHLIFDGVLTVTDGGNLKLAGNFTTTADDVLVLTFDGSNWYELSRSVN